MMKFLGGIGRKILLMLTKLISIFPYQILSTNTNETNIIYN